MSDKDLIIAYQSGHKKAFAFLVKRWHVQFCKLAYWYVKDADVSKDIAQESWTIILNKLTALEEPDKFKSWAIRIVNRKAIDWLRASKRRAVKRQHFSIENTTESVEEFEKEDLSEINSLLKRAIEKLSDDQKIIIKLFYLEDYSLKQISELLNVSIGTVKSRLFYTREKLKNKLKNNKNER